MAPITRAIKRKAGNADEQAFGSTALNYDAELPPLPTKACKTSSIMSPGVNKSKRFEKLPPGIFKIVRHPPIPSPVVVHQPPPSPTKLEKYDSGIVKPTEKDKYAKIAEHNSKESPFLRLPGEIRNKIYEYALGGHNIGIFQRQEHFRSKEATFATQHPRKSNYYNLRRPPHPRYKPTVFALPHTCRQIYNETSVMPYRLNKFKFWNECLMRQWVGKRLKIQVEQIQTVEPSADDIRSAYFSERTKPFSNIFPSLKTLVIPVTMLKAEEERDEQMKRSIVKFFRELEWSNVKVEWGRKEYLSR